jgi:hypothetical protein
MCKLCEENNFATFFFVANSDENCPSLGMYPKLSLSGRDILDCSHTAGAI